MEATSPQNMWRSTAVIGLEVKKRAGAANGSVERRGLRKGANPRHHS